MMGLLLGLGMLIDGSIVVTEYADEKYLKAYKELKPTDSKRMFYPILSSTATTMLPLRRLFSGLDSQVNLYVFTNCCFHSSIGFVGLCNDCSASSRCCIWSRRSSLMSGESEKTGEVVFDRISSFYSKWVRIFAKNPFETILSVFFLLSVIIISYDRFGKGGLFSLCRSCCC